MLSCTEHSHSLLQYTSPKSKFEQVHLTQRDARAPSRGLSCLCEAGGWLSTGVEIWARLGTTPCVSLSMHRRFSRQTEKPCLCSASYSPPDLSRWVEVFSFLLGKSLLSFGISFCNCAVWEQYENQHFIKIILLVKRDLIVSRIISLVSSGTGDTSVLNIYLKK